MYRCEKEKALFTNSKFNASVSCAFGSRPARKSASDEITSYKKRSRSGKYVLLAATFAAVVGGAAWAREALTLKINGKASAVPPITVQGKTYIPLEALKAAGVGVQVTGSTIELQLPTKTAEGGTNQQVAVEGKGGEWLFNGIWRFRVLTVEAADPDKVGKGWSVKVEIRNGSKFNDYSPGGTGWEGITVVTEDGNSVAAASDAVDLSSKGLAQGAGNTVT
ncbi:MAG: hypothetical protein JWN14_1926, partial [Chthonomonadales bacterium]|nr:hypothetical protein [Chthonomonadales bacterium]